MTQPVTGHVPEPSRVVCVTGHEFGIRAFEGILSSPAFLDGHIEVPLLIGLDAELAGGTVGYRSVQPLATEYGIPHVFTTDGRLTSLADTIRECRPHYLLVIGWSRLVPPEVLAIPGGDDGSSDRGGFGCIGMHPTRLPFGRGQAPIPWTIIKGLDNTALSVFFLEAGADTGSVIAQHELDVHPRETASSLFHRIAATHFTAGMELAAGLGRREIPSRPQDPATATVWGKRRPADGEITAAMSSAEIDALVRALLGPYPRAFVTIEGRSHQIGAVGSVRPIGDHTEAAVVAADRVHFPCRDGVVTLLLATSKITR